MHRRQCSSCRWSVIPAERVGLQLGRTEELPGAAGCRLLPAGAGAGLNRIIVRRQAELDRRLDDHACRRRCPADAGSKAMTTEVSGRATGCRATLIPATGSRISWIVIDEGL